ncbi:MAG: hypothetical protein RL685_207 [Pseudomonadota bacterium]
MTESKLPQVESETERRLRRGEGEEVVVLEAGDPVEPARADGGDWDWDTDAVSGAQHCATCGAWGPVLHLDDGSRVCAACAHGAANAP